MARQIQIRRGTADEHETFIGVVGEITMDTTNNTLRVHDGATPGGFALAKQTDISNDNVSDIPDTGKTINVSACDTYTFPTDGWLIITTNIAGSVQFTSDKYATSQNAPFAYGCLNAAGVCQSLMYRVQAGETITRTYKSGNWSALFVQCKH